MTSVPNVLRSMSAKCPSCLELVPAAGLANFLSSPWAGLLFHFRYVAAEVQGIAEPHYDGASDWSADAVKVIADGLHCSVALDGVRQMQGLSHGITPEGSTVLRIRNGT